MIDTYNKEEQDKRNFLTWYKMASFDDVREAIKNNREKFMEMMEKYEVEDKSK
jgi:hypothetical protein